MSSSTGPRATRLIDVAMVLFIAGVGALFLAQGLHLASVHPTSRFAVAGDEGKLDPAPRQKVGIVR